MTLEYVEPLAVPSSEWRADAACVRHREVFRAVERLGSNDPHRAETVDAAKAICQGCPVLEACRADSLLIPHRDDVGVVGGLTARERGWLRKTGRPVHPLAGRPRVRPAPAIDLSPSTGTGLVDRAGRMSPNREPAAIACGTSP